MDTLLIRLYGQLSAETGSRLYLEAKERFSSPLALCLDFSDVRSLDSIGMSYLEKLGSKAKESDSHLSCFGLSESGIGNAEIAWIQSRIPFYRTEFEAKQALESFIDSEKEIPKAETHAESIVTVDKKPKLGKSRTFCPFCIQELNVLGAGDYSCPNCKGKFHLDSKGWARAYERLV